MNAKCEKVYHFRTEKDHRRLCLSSMEYLKYCGDRRDARRDPVQVPDTRPEASGAIPLAFVIGVSLGGFICAVCFNLIKWFVSR